MNFTVDIFKESEINFDWQTLYVGFKLNIIGDSEITNYAMEYLANHPEVDNQHIIQLAWGGNDVDYDRLLDNLLEELNLANLLLDAKVEQFEKRKWRFAILSYLKKLHRDNLDELLNKIAEVYADFNYPEDMDDFIYYLPPKGGYNPALYSKEENIDRMTKFFDEFLTKEQQALKNETIF